MAFYNFDLGGQTSFFLKVECGEPPPDGGGGWGAAPVGGGGGWGTAPPGGTDEEERKLKVNNCPIFIIVTYYQR